MASNKTTSALLREQAEGSRQGGFRVRTTTKGGLTGNQELREHTFHPGGECMPDRLSPMARQEVVDYYQRHRAKYPLLYPKLKYPFGPPSRPSIENLSGRKYLLLDPE